MGTRAERMWYGGVKVTLVAVAGGMGNPTFMCGGRDTWGSSDPSSRPDCTAQGFSSGKSKPHNFWL